MNTMDERFRLFPESVSPHAAAVDSLYLFLLGISLLFTIGVAGTIVYFCIRYRRGNKNVDRTETVQHFYTLEITWTLIPLVLSLVIFAWGAELFYRGSRPPADALEIQVVGKQWMWKFQHPDGRAEINTLHVPTGRAVKLNMISEDVIHSLYVPALRMKQDVLPGSYTNCWFAADTTGTHHLFCAEYCGTNHSRMRGEIILVGPAEYEEWLAGDTSNEPPLVAGRRLFTELRCNTCHAIGPGLAAAPVAAPPRGPALDGLYSREVTLRDGGKVRADDAYLRESILRPQAKVVAGYEPIMPSFDSQVNEQQILQLITYIKSLKRTEPDPVPKGTPRTNR